MEIKDFETQSIEELKIPWVLCDIHRRKKSGILHVMGSNKKFGRRIYLVDGEIKFALSNQEGDRLGRILVEKGIITEAQFTKTILKMDGKKRFGQYLIEQGLLTDEQLEDVLLQQTEEIVLSTFDLDSGLFFFEERELALPADLQRVFDFRH